MIASPDLDNHKKMVMAQIDARNKTSMSKKVSLRPLALNSGLLLKFEKVASEEGVAFLQHCPHKPLKKHHCAIPGVYLVGT